VNGAHEVARDHRFFSGEFKSAERPASYSGGSVLHKRGVRGNGRKQGEKSGRRAGGGGAAGSAAL